MADFAFNWNNYTPQTGGEDARIAALRAKAQAGMQGYNNSATLAQQQMQGFAPNVQQPALDPVQQTSAETYRGSYESDMAELSQLEGLLRTIDSQIAELENSDPRDTERKLASLGASIGDMSLYQGILAREQNQAAQQKSNASSIDNMLFEADKLSWGLNSKSDEERGIVKQNIQAVLDRAKQVAEQTGTPLPQKYRELEQKLQDSDKASIVNESERRRANDLWLKARNETLENADIQEMEDYIKKNPNSEISGQYRQLIEQYQGKTKESKASASKRKQDALDLYYSLNGLSKEESTKRIANLSPRERKLLEDFYPEMLK